MTASAELPARKMKLAVIVGFVALSLACSACASRIGKPLVTSSGRSGADVKPGAFGADDAKRPATDAQVSKASGTASDDHSEVASKTADGGKSATDSATARPPAEGTLATVGVDTPGTEGEQSGKLQGAATKAAGDRSGPGTGLEPTASQAAGDGGAMNPKAKPAPIKPMDESDPSIGDPPPASRRRVT